MKLKLLFQVKSNWYLTLRSSQSDIYFGFRICDLTFINSSLPDWTCTDGSVEGSSNGKSFNGVSGRQQLPSVSTALVLAVGIGIFEALALSLGSGLFLNVMGISLVGYIYSSYMCTCVHVCLLVLNSHPSSDLCTFVGIVNFLQKA